MESAYTLANLTFSNNAASFNLLGTGNTLTLNAGVTNNSPNPQLVNVPINLASASGVTFNAAAGALVFSNSISSSGANGVILTGTTNMFGGPNIYTGPTTVNGGVLVLLSTPFAYNASSLITNNATLELDYPSALSGSALTLNSGSTLRLRGDASADYTPGQGLIIPTTASTFTFDANSLTAGVTGKILSLAGTSPIFAFPNNVNETINVTGGSTYNLGLGDITMTSGSHTPYFALNINTLLTGAGVVINSITSGFWGNYVNFSGGGRATVAGNLSNTSNGSLNVVVNGGTIVTLLGSTVKANTGDAYKYVVENGSLVLDTNNALSTYASGTGLNQCIFVLGATTNATYFQNAGNYTPAAGVLFGTNNAYNAAVYLGDSNNATGGLSFPAGMLTYVSDGDLGFTNGGVFTIGGQNSSGVNIYSNNITLGMTPGGGKSVTLVAAAGGEVDFDGRLLANAPNTTAGVTVGDSVHSGVVHLNGINTYGGLTTVTNSTLGGSGTIAGSVLVLSGGHTLPGGGMTNTIGGNLTYNTGAEADFDLDASAAAGVNDQIILSGATSSLNPNGVSVGIHLIAGDLDKTTDYVLITNLTSGANAGVFAIAPVWLGTPPSSPANYSIITRSNQVVLHYSTAEIASGSVLPNPAGRGQLVTFTVNAMSPGNSISSVNVNASSIGGSSALALNPSGGNNFANGVTIGSTIPAGTYLLPATVTDSVGGVNTYTFTLTITPVSEIWDGLGSDSQWSTGQNWVSGFGPVSGDAVTFAGTTQLTPNVQANYGVSSLTFSNNAGSFNLTNDGTHTLTLNGNVTNNSANAQTLSLPVSLGAPLTLNAASGNITVSNNITGSGGITAIGATNTLAGNTSYAGATTINSGVLALAGNDTLYGPVTVGGGTLVMSGSEGVSSFSINSTGTLLISGAGQLNNGTYGPAVVDNGTFNYSGTNSLTMLGVISGTGGLTLNSGTLNLSSGAGGIGGETYTGPTVVNGGTLNLNFNNPAVGALNTSSGITINKGGKIVALLSSALEGYNSPSSQFRARHHQCRRSARRVSGLHRQWQRLLGPLAGRPVSEWRHHQQQCRLFAAIWRLGSV